jgi:hypothetical protein
MKAKLIKTKKHYMIKMEGVGYITDYESTLPYKLSKRNCDEIFEVVDVEKLAEECAETAHTMDELYENGLFYGFISGFKKAMELNKDKVFTLKDMGNLWDFCTYNKGTFAEFIQQPTEIEVEIVMKPYTEISDSWTLEKKEEPKLDENGCLILTKKEIK